MSRRSAVYCIKLLEILEIQGCLVTLDAMGCQREIAQQIIDAGADYVLAVKDNQPKLHQAIQEFFTEHLEDDCASIAFRRDESHEKGHGRLDDRYYYLAKLPEDFPPKETGRAFGRLAWRFASPNTKAASRATKCVTTSRVDTSVARSSLPRYAGIGVLRIRCIGNST